MNRSLITQNVYFLKIFLLVLSIAGMPKPAFSANENQTQINLKETIKTHIVKAFGDDCRVQVGKILLDSTQIDKINNIRFTADRPSGKARLSGEIDGKPHQFEAYYTVWKKAWIPKKRILPGTLIKSDDLDFREVDISSGLNNQSWALFVDSVEVPNNFLAKNTLIEGFPILRTQLQKRPDVNRGESVRLQMSSGDLTLITDAVAQESAVIGDSVRVFTTKTKKEFRGKLISKNHVEVNL